MDKKKLPVKKTVVQPEVEARKVTAVKAEAVEAVLPIGGSDAAAGGLRKQAEKIARKKAPDVPENLQGLAPATVRKLLHELRVHQIELEMQNEELRTAQAKLEKSRAQYFELFDQAPVGYFNISEQGLILDTNLAAADLLGVVPGYLQAKTFTSFIYKEDRDIYYLHRKQLLATRAPQVSEMRMARRDGPLFWTRMESNVVQDGKSGKPICRVTISDITEHKRAEEVLRKSEEKYRLLADNASDVIWTADKNLNTTYISPSVYAMQGHTPEEAMNLTPEQRYTPESLELISKRFLEVMANEEAGKGQPDNIGNYEAEYIRKDGSTYWGEINASFIRDATGKAVGILGVTRDIDLRKRAEEALTKSRDLITNLARLVPGVIYQYQLYPDGRSAFPYSSPGMYDIYEVTPEEVREDATAVFGRLHPDDYDRVADTIQESARTLQIFYCEFRVILPRQGLRWRWSQAHPERMVDGGTLWHGIISDITERKLAEEALREEGWRLQSIIEGTHAGTWEWNVQTGETVFNETWAQITGYSLAELSPISIKTWEALVHPDDLKQSDELLERHFSGELPYYDCDCRMKHKDGHWVWVHDRGRIVTRTADGKPLMMFGTHSDITDRKQLEEERERIEKLEAVGRLAGGIAHDFNNILTAILGNIGLARMEAAPGSEISVSLEQAEQASLRAKDLTVQLLTFSKGGAPVKKLGSLTELLRDTADFVLQGSNVKCRYSMPADLWHAEIDPGQVSQVIRNLVVNAQQSMPAGGTMEISAENLALTEKQSSGRGLPLRPGNYVMISVADHGSGIPQDHLKKIFEPFFTTRPKSSGMGLATSFSIVRQHGGHLSVESKAGSGSTFHIYLPTSVESTAAKQDKIDAASRTGKARILVMDDEKTVREIAGRMLKHIGYADIEFATDGIEAIKLYKAAMESGNPFSAAILDLTIPGGMGGEVTIRNLLKIDPAVKAIVSSGYVDDPVMAQYSEYGFSGMVAKPYTIAELRKAVQDVIG